MSIVPPNPTQGQALFEGTQAFYTHDDAADNKDGGVYDHTPIEMSATEAESWCDWFRYINQLLLTGADTVKVRNETGSPLPAGPVRIVGFNVANDCHLVDLADADGAAPADYILGATLATATNGIAYTDVDVVGFDTSTKAVGDPIYLSATGGFTITAPTGADQIQQVIGQVKVVGVSGTVACHINAPAKIGTSWLQAQAVTLAKLVNASAQGKLLGRTTASAGVWEEAAVDGSTIEFLAGGSIRVKDAGITYAKIQNISATDKLLGRLSSGAGVTEEIACTAAGRALLDDASAAAQVATLGLSSAPIWLKMTKAHTDLQAAALTNDIEILSLPAGAVIHAVRIKQSTAFAGTLISAYTLSVGIVGTLNKYASAFDVFQAVADTTFQVSSTVGSENYGAATSIRLAATSVGANLDQSTAGAVDVWILTSQP